MPNWLRANVPGTHAQHKTGVDREAKAIRNIRLAEEGPFKSKGRGEFSAKSIRAITKLARQAPGGLKSRFAHPHLSDDGLGKLLGRIQNVSTDTITKEIRGEMKEALVSRGDLTFLDSAFETPSGNLADYAMKLVEEGETNAGMSLVIEPEEEFRLDRKGRRLIDENTGEELPPIWHPVALHACDICDSGDATSSMLAAGLTIDGLPDEVLHKATELLRQQFNGKSREFVQKHLSDWTQRALDAYWPVDDEDTVEVAGVFTDVLQKKLDLRARA